jgi:uncharacterized membrane protein YeaQ/YmgE (transglycosylase-associated protein family)
MDLVPLLIQVVCGAVGGNVVGKLSKTLDMGTLVNSVAGILGGGLGGQLLGMLGMSGGGTGTLDIGNVVGSIAAGGVGGGALLAIVAVIRKTIAK